MTFPISILDQSPVIGSTLPAEAIQRTIDGTLPERPAHDVDVDRREKALAYAASSRLELFLLVDPDRRRIEAARPVGGRLRWNFHVPGDVIFTDYGDMHKNKDKNK